MSRRRQLNGIKPVERIWWAWWQVLRRRKSRDRAARWLHVQASQTTILAGTATSRGAEHGKLSTSSDRQTVVSSKHRWLINQSVPFQSGLGFTAVMKKQFIKYIKILVDCCKPVSEVTGHRLLYSASPHHLTVPRYQLNAFGHRTFSVTGSTPWNFLPDRLRDATLSSDSFTT